MGRRDGKQVNIPLARDRGEQSSVPSGRFLAADSLSSDGHGQRCPTMDMYCYLFVIISKSSVRNGVTGNPSFEYKLHTGLSAQA